MTLTERNYVSQKLLLYSIKSYIKRAFETYIYYNNA